MDGRVRGVGIDAAAEAPRIGSGSAYIPIGLGVGKVVLLDKGLTMKAFVELQHTVWHDDHGAPGWQIFAGVNVHSSIRRLTQ